MEEFIELLNEEELNLLKEIKKDYITVELDELFDILTREFQKNGVENIDGDSRQMLLESILDKLGSI